MAPPRYRAAPPDHYVAVALDAFAAVFHRPSGMTHLLTSPAPELLDLLRSKALTASEVSERLMQLYTVSDAGDGALDERLVELTNAGLVLRA